MHFVISGTGPTDPPERCCHLSLLLQPFRRRYGPLMLFHDAVLMPWMEPEAKLVPVGPPNRYEEAVSHRT